MTGRTKVTGIMTNFREWYFTSYDMSLEISNGLLQTLTHTSQLNKPNSLGINSQQLKYDMRCPF